MTSRRLWLSGCGGQQQAGQQAAIVKMRPETLDKFGGRKVMILRANMFQHVSGDQRSHLACQLQRPTGDEAANEPGAVGVAAAGGVLNMRYRKHRYGDFLPLIVNDRAA